MSIIDNFRNGWNAFIGRDPTKTVKEDYSYGGGYISSIRPDRMRFKRGNERSIVAGILTRIAIDCATASIIHATVDDNRHYTGEVDSGINDCLNVSANLDQTGRAFRQNIFMSLLDEGVICIVPTDCSNNPYQTSSYDIYAMRVGKILEWFPLHVRVRLYNERTGKHEEIVVAKNTVAIVENPFYAVMNEPNSTLRRLMRKLAMLDTIDEQTAAGKLDLIIQLPYVIKTEARRQQAENRRKDIEMQLAGSRYGIAYTDGTERITQLNRSLENNLLKQITDLTETLYSQLGIPKTVFDGTADEATMLNYNNSTIEPIVSAVTDEFTRKFITANARTRGQAILYIKDPFKLVPINNLADIADRFTRNEIMTSNEIRQIVGLKPADDPGADELRNKNLNQEMPPEEGYEEVPEEGYEDGYEEGYEE